MGEMIQNGEPCRGGKSHVNTHERELSVSPEFRVGMEVEVVIEEFVLCVYWKGVAREEENALEIKTWRSELDEQN